MVYFYVVYVTTQRSVSRGVKRPLTVASSDSDRYIVFIWIKCCTLHTLVMCHIGNKCSQRGLIRQVGGFCTISVRGRAGFPYRNSQKGPRLQLCSFQRFTQNMPPVRQTAT